MSFQGTATGTAGIRTPAKSKKLTETPFAARAEQTLPFAQTGRDPVKHVFDQWGVLICNNKVGYFPEGFHTSNRQLKYRRPGARFCSTKVG